MEKKSFYDYLINILKKDSRFIDQDGNIIRNAIIDKALKYDDQLLSVLLDDKKLKEVFFKKINGSLIFLQSLFMGYIQDKNFLIDSYTKYKNKIGLNLNGKFLDERDEVSLVWPFKDTILEGGQTKDEQKRKEIFFNEILAKDEIDRLFEPKVLTNFKRYTKDSEEKVTKLARDSYGVIKENLVIKGNNLLALYSLKKQFAGKIKLIYIDPPYNPRSDANTFAYNNTFNHSTWLTFMKNRLEVAKELLCDDGLIFIDIDHNELFYLGVLADEIFGYENRIGVLAVVHNLKGRYKEFFSTAHENKIVYAKNAKKAKIKDFAEDPADYPFEDEISRYKTIGLQRTGSGSRRQDRPKLFYPIFIDRNTKAISTKKRHGWIEILPIDSQGIERRWRWDKIKVEKDWKTEIIVKENGGRYKIFTKLRSHGEKPKTIWFKPEYSSTSGTNELKKLLGENKFSFPKSVELVKDTIKIATEKNDIILDFFAGSGTTAQAVYELNQSDNGKRKFIICEQMDYAESVTKERVKKVIKNDDSFIYFELKKYNEEFIDRIINANSTQKLLDIWKDMKEKSFLNYQVDIKKQEENIEEFKALQLEKQKQVLIELLDKNALYVPLSDIDDTEFKVNREDKELNKQFYG